MSLQLITTEQFNGLECNFYRNANDDILLTREQVGAALDYSNPQKAIAKLHDKHKDRLNLLSVQIKDRIPHSGVSELQERVYYTERGVMEICRWSRQPKANQFMDWVWDIVERHRSTKGMNGFDPTISTILQKLASQQEANCQMLANQQQQLIALTNLISSTLPQPYKPPLTRWMKQTFDRVDAIGESIGKTRKEVLHQLYTEFEESYDLDLNENLQEYCSLHNISYNGLYTLNAIGAEPEYKKRMDLLLQSYEESFHSQQDANNSDPVITGASKILGGNFWSRENPLPT